MKTGIIGQILLDCGYNTEELQSLILYKWFRSIYPIEHDGDELYTWVIKYGTHEVDSKLKHLITDEDRKNEFIAYIKQKHYFESYVNKWKY